MDSISFLVQKRDAMLAEMRALESRIEGIDLAIRILSPQRRAAWGEIKQLIFDLLEESENDGLNAKKAVEMAKMRGHNLVRETAAGILSRLAKDGAVSYDGAVYRLKSARDAR